MRVCVRKCASACVQCVCGCVCKCVCAVCVLAQKGKERKCIEINVWANKFYSDFFPFEVVEGSNDELAFND